MAPRNSAAMFVIDDTILGMVLVQRYNGLFMYGFLCIDAYPGLNAIAADGRFDVAGTGSDS